MLRVLSRSWMVLVLSIVLSGCSLLEVKLDSQTTPLTQQELNARLMTREYAKLFFTQVEDSADLIAQSYPADDTLHQSYVLLWKIHAEQGLQQAAYQTSPMSALIDTWVFTAQMNQFYAEGEGADLFTVDHAVNTARSLDQEAEKLAKGVLSSSDFKKSKAFVAEFVASNPFKDLTFRSTPAYREWLTYLGKDESQIVQSLGTMPEAMSDASDRLSLMADQTPKLMSWKAELVAMNSSLTGEDLSMTLESLRQTSASMQDFIENNPEYMQTLASIMSAEMQPLLNDLSDKTDQKLAMLSDERVALEKMVTREREALVQMIEKERIEIAGIVTSERELFTQDLDRVSQEVVVLAIDKLMELIKGVIIYFILFILVVFFAPLGIGYWLGKRTANK
ncbi:Methyl-accepting chemotaxis protein [Vibrio chagasii]|uniref:chemotaxis protein n=1 Tax=Vibrio TaxID=662 RepID=UPI001493C84E|nr:MULTISPECIES: chemotaxis protein [Vibrio]MCG9675541.1 chemotaxis protein [Vibrio chagasii]NOI40430.1 chemotaxis protein [Vibrio sp. 070316B]CAH6807231.1 Methyl-accepting chemotaxis protein [Vibrio chagasii]CAH6840217.1 Methyl-accepting chemotaxis protein [Vibrio chagasii]CAH6843312.1 Methyl-accepting chemotaxis protein [Vibrio chagasii]